MNVSDLPTFPGDDRDHDPRAWQHVPIDPTLREATVTYEVFEEDPPSFVPAYIMSAFVLLGVLGLAWSDFPAWPPSAGHVVMVVWFGVLFYWIVQHARHAREYRSNRLTVTAEAYKHSFRYAVAETTFVEIPVADIEEVHVSAYEPRSIEIRAKNTGDLYFLPPIADLDRVIAVLRAGNPAIRVTS